jgi:hypothetical protein
LALDLEGVPDQRQAVGAALAQAGVQGVAWRGWRCRMNYPAPLIEMQIALRFTAPR